MTREGLEGSAMSNVRVCSKCGKWACFSSLPIPMTVQVYCIGCSVKAKKALEGKALKPSPLFGDTGT